jgi:hypothetical protein
MPTATSIASVPPPALAFRAATHSDTALSSRNETTPPTSTSAAPPNAREPSPASSKPSSVASMTRNASSPTVSAITTRSQPGGMRRTQGNQSMPRATGITPT